MEELLLFQQILLEGISNKTRYLLDKIDWSNRLIAIKGARGTGKTTLLLQRLGRQSSNNSEMLYATLDDLYFLKSSLIDLAKEFTLNGGTHLFLDEVHKYPYWSRELKLIYDRYPKLNIVFTSSSMLEIYKGESDLSRRAVTYELNELSFREFLEFGYDIELPVFQLEEILDHHQNISREIIQKLDSPVKYFQEYLQYGCYPYFQEGREVYLGKLLRTASLIIETDMNVVEGIVYEDSLKIKKLLVAIAQSAPFTPNISKLSERLGMNRKFLIQAIRLLESAHLIMQFFKPGKGIGTFTKPEKLYLNNPNLVVALGETKAEKGTLRETFFANQIRNFHQVNLAEKGDFLIDEKFIFEVGGKSKNNKQIQNIPNSFVVRDDIEVGVMNTIPLWLFGFLY
ncbi:ATP-binding protein [Christiangramia forsetii]|uniref:AAA domain-containing protein n=2 Tax=Christiangramia forsetii TaxID=411153 RepID=A0M6Q4_CHRFK|nr:AAA family ATPase [Christiangramia forsetii]GGG29841.1 ATPase AAA [Christiangramia forsetii]CAL68299.1 conserved hypothetical protein [Christiangramia forsetii KT0803]